MIYSNAGVQLSKGSWIPPPPPELPSIALLQLRKPGSGRYWNGNINKYFLSTSFDFFFFINIIFKAFLTSLWNLEFKKYHRVGIRSALEIFLGTGELKVCKALSKSNVSLALTTARKCSIQEIIILVNSSVAGYAGSVFFQFYVNFANESMFSAFHL